MTVTRLEVTCSFYFQYWGDDLFGHGKVDTITFKSSRFFLDAYIYIYIISFTHHPTVSLKHASAADPSSFSATKHPVLPHENGAVGTAFSSFSVSRWMETRSSNMGKNDEPRCEPRCWNIYLHFPQKLPSFVGKYSSTMMIASGIWGHF